MDDRAAKRTGYPLTIPDALLDSEPMRTACATRNFAEVFRLVNRRTGSSYAVMAAAIGKMTSSRISDVIRGVRGIRGKEVIERIADGFGIPGHMLDLPPRPWEGSPSRSTEEASTPYADQGREIADAHGDVAIAGPRREESATREVPDTLLVSVWIEGRKQVVEISRRELMAGATGVAVASSTMPQDTAGMSGGRWGWHSPVAAYSRQGVEASTVGTLAESEKFPLLGISPFEGMTLQQSGEHLLRMFLHLDDEMGGDTLFPAISRYIARMAVNVRAKPGDGMAVFGQLNQMAGWLALDANYHGAAKSYFDAAVQVGDEVGDRGLKSSALAYMSLQETYRGRPESALALAEESISLGVGQLTPLTRTMLGTRLARAHAGLGNKAACLRTLDSVRSDFGQAGSQEEPQYVSYVDPIEVAAQEGACYLDLQMSRKAVTSLTSAIGLLSIHAPNRVRDRVHYLSRLAKCYLLDGEVEQACQTGSHALDLSRTIGSARVAERLGELAESLSLYSDVPSVIDFREQYRATTRDLA